MRIGSRLIALAILLLVTTVACSGTGSGESGNAPAEVAGPALVLFYTDN
jgi:hypothetical protein